MTDIPSGTDLSKVPMRANPSGAPPDFEHGPNLIRAVQGVGVSLAVVTTVFLATRLRIYTRLNRGLVLDDVFLLIAYAMALAYTAQASTLKRLCRHTWDTPLGDIDEDYLKKLLATSILYGPMFFFSKAAILILYHRAFNLKTWMRWSCWILGIFLFVGHAQSIPQSFIYCMPHNEKPWDLTILSNCGHITIPGLVHGGLNVVADVVLVLLPIPIITKLHVPTSKKIAISAIFATGVLALICSILAVYYRIQISYGADPVWSNAQAWIVIQAEIYATICVACAPSLAKLWKLDFKATRLYATLQSLLYASRGTSRKEWSYPSARQMRRGELSSESTSGLQKRPTEAHTTPFSISSVYTGEHSYEMPLHGRFEVHRHVDVEIKSEALNKSVV